MYKFKPHGVGYANVKGPWPVWCLPVAREEEIPTGKTTKS